MKRYLLVSILNMTIILSISGQTGETVDLRIITSELIFTDAPFLSCHASTLAEIPGGLIVAFFGGTAESNPDVGIWICQYNGGRWTEPEEVATGIQSDGKRYPCWNPVLFRSPGGNLLLFYKVGPNPREWWGMLMRSSEDDIKWSEPVRIPDGFLGPVKNKPVLLKNGTLLCPSSTEHDGWIVRMERSDQEGMKWDKTVLERGDRKFSAIQPTILLHPGNLQILCRTREGVIAESWSADEGITWTPLAATDLPNPNSGIDAVTLGDGKHILVYNPVTTMKGSTSGPRTPLSVALSSDGRTWEEVVQLENSEGEYSYPAVIQTSDGLIHITYTWKRKSIKHVAIEIK
jgi:predicted neuraminidase